MLLCPFAFLVNFASFFYYLFIFSSNLEISSDLICFDAITHLTTIDDPINFNFQLALFFDRIQLKIAFIQRLKINPVFLSWHKIENDMTTFFLLKNLA